MTWAGVDLVHVPGFATQLAQPGSTLGGAAGVFTPGERRDARDRPESLAVRWAAKEAFVKAWSSALWGRAPVADEQVHRQIEVVVDAWGRPRLVLHGHVAVAVEHSIGQVETSLSLSHDGDHAIAVVLVSLRLTPGDGAGAERAGRSAPPAGG